MRGTGWAPRGAVAPAVTRAASAAQGGADVTKRSAPMRGLSTAVSASTSRADAEDRWSTQPPGLAQRIRHTSSAARQQRDQRQRDRDAGGVAARHRQEMVFSPLGDRGGDVFDVGFVALRR